MVESRFRYDPGSKSFKDITKNIKSMNTYVDAVSLLPNLGKKTELIKTAK